jgi:hypothetical protein
MENPSGRRWKMKDALAACALAPIVAVAEGLARILSAVYAATRGDKFENLLL